MFTRGEVVKVLTFMDGIVTRRVVGETASTVFLCNESEFQSAARDGREPTSIGFPIGDVIQNAENEKGTVKDHATD